MSDSNPPPTDWVYWLGAPGPPPSVTELGGKGAQLAELSKLRYNVPRGFVITAAAFRKLRAENEALRRAIASPPSDGGNRRVSLEQYCADAHAAIVSARFPDSLEITLVRAFADLRAERTAVRSSYSAEDGQQASYAGQFESYLNVGRTEFLASVLNCWASLFTPRALAYDAGGFWQSGECRSFAVVVQQMVSSVVSGVMFTRHPFTRSADHVYVEAIWGLGEAHVGGHVSPDTYTVDKATRQVTARSYGHQRRKLVASATGGVQWATVSAPPQMTEMLAPSVLAELVSLGIDLEDVLGYACDVEWAISRDQIFTLQCRSITA